MAMDDNKEKAKEIFFKYACNSFLMWHEDVWDDYKKFCISDDQEKDWRSEYISYWVGRLSIDNMKAVNMLRNAYAHEALPNLIEMAGRGDGYAKLWYANAIWDIATGSTISKSIRRKSITTAIALWQSLVQGPIELSDYHKENVFPFLAPKDEFTLRKYVLDYAKGRLAQLSKKRQGK